MPYINCGDVAARIHLDMVNDDRNGYSQSPRWGGDHPDGNKTLYIDGLPYTYALGSYDCSSSVIKAWQLAIQYTNFKGKLDGATYTGNMRSVFEKSGLFYSSYDAAKRSDIYLNDTHHTALCQDGGNDGVFGYDAMSQFSINENGKTTGGKVGDQTGREAYVGAYYNYSKGWNAKLHYNGAADGNYDVNTNTATGTKTVDELAQEVINGKWGSGDERRNRLTSAGYDYQAVQTRVNEILSANKTGNATVSGYQLKGIDVSSWNGSPFNAQTESAYKDSDFIIVKATQGISYKNPSYEYAYNRAKADGKLLGTYHYAAGNDAKAEARFYYESVKNTIGEAIPVIDWEQGSNKAWNNKEWVKTFVTEFYNLSGVYPMIYAGSYVLDQVANCKDICALWVPGYPTPERTDWTPPAFPYKVTPWDGFVIWQYSSANGVDRNVSTINKEQWLKLAKGDLKEVPKTESTPAQSPYQLEVDGLWGCATTKALQSVLGTCVDGYVDGQDSSLDKCNRGGLLTSSWKKASGGSPMVKALQKKLSVSADGYFGPLTCKALQSFLGTATDGYVDKPSDMVKALQKRLNSGALF